MIGNRQPTSKNILALLIELYADQMGVKVEYKIESGGEDGCQGTPMTR